MGSQMSTHQHLSDVTERITKLDARMHEVKRLRELLRKAQRSAQRARQKLRRNRPHS
jgi:hypothetical protein